MLCVRQNKSSNINELGLHGYRKMQGSFNFNSRNFPGNSTVGKVRGENGGMGARTGRPNLYGATLKTATLTFQSNTARYSTRQISAPQTCGQWWEQRHCWPKATFPNERGTVIGRARTDTQAHGVFSFCYCSERTARRGCWITRMCEQRQRGW